MRLKLSFGPVASWILFLARCNTDSGEFLHGLSVGGCWRVPLHQGVEPPKKFWASIFSTCSSGGVFFTDGSTGTLVGGV